MYSMGAPGIWVAPRSWQRIVIPCVNPSYNSATGPSLPSSNLSFTVLVWWCKCKVQYMVHRSTWCMRVVLVEHATYGV